MPACVDLDQRCLGGLWNEEQWHRELAEPKRLCLGLIERGRLLGLACGWLVADELHITAVAVDPERRRCGLGRSLLDALLQRARMAGARHATLEVSSDNTAAVGLYGLPWISDSRLPPQLLPRWPRCPDSVVSTNPSGLAR